MNGRVTTLTTTTTTKKISLKENVQIIWNVGKMFVQFIVKQQAADDTDDDEMIK